MKNYNAFTIFFVCVISITFFSFAEIKHLNDNEDDFANVDVIVTNGHFTEEGCGGTLPILCDSQPFNHNAMLPASASLVNLKMISSSNLIEMKFPVNQINAVMKKQFDKKELLFYSDFLIGDESIVTSLDPTANILLLKSGVYPVYKLKNDYIVRVDFVKY